LPNDYNTAVIKPPIGKIADVFGRFESFTLTIFLYTIGYIQQAGANSVKTYASAQIFWAAGFNGLQILQQIFVADTTDLLNRALFSTLFDVPFLWTVWAGPEVGASILAGPGWRWGYGIWAIILPVCFIPLAASLWMNQRRAKKLGFELPSPFHGYSAWEVLKNLWYDLDLFGLLLLTAGISLILLPLTLAPNASGEWRNPSMIAMLVVGGVTMIAFPFWETSKKLAPKAFFPPNLFKKRTVVVGTLIAFFYFSECAGNSSESPTNGGYSGFLHERLPILQLLSSNRAEQVSRHGWLHYPSFLFRLHGRLNRRILDDQIHRALQILRHIRVLHLSYGHVRIFLSSF
jgi:MFS family permease